MAAAVPAPPDGRHRVVALVEPQGSGAGAQIHPDVPHHGSAGRVTHRKHVVDARLDGIEICLCPLHERHCRQRRRYALYPLRAQQVRSRDTRSASHPASGPAAFSVTRQSSDGRSIIGRSPGISIRFVGGVPLATVSTAPVWPTASIRRTASATSSVQGSQPAPSCCRSF